MIRTQKRTFSDYLRSVRTEESAWEEDDMFLEHDYYNSIPGKEPPLGGLVDSRLKTTAAMLGHIHCVPQNKAAQVQLQRSGLRIRLLH